MIVQRWCTKLNTKFIFYIYKIIQRESVHHGQRQRFILGLLLDHTQVIYILLYTFIQKREIFVFSSCAEYFLIHSPLRQDKTEAKSNDNPRWYPASFTVLTSPVGNRSLHWMAQRIRYDQGVKALETMQLIVILEQKNF